MVLSALGVTSSDLYNLTTKMKPVLKLTYKEKEEQKIIDEVLLRLPDMVNSVNGNGFNHEHAPNVSTTNGNGFNHEHAPIIRRENETSNGFQLNSETVHVINDSDTENLVCQPTTNSNRNSSSKSCTIM